MLSDIPDNADVKPSESLSHLAPDRAGALLLRPGTIWVLIVAVHVAGRIAAVCHPNKIDSVTYAVAAYRIWQPGASFSDLVEDKPPGQALITGWSYRLFPGPPTRLTLVPIESAFLLATYIVFSRIAGGLCGRRFAAPATLLFVIAFNSYNALDFTTDGFDLNENYMALPMLLAVLAQLRMRSPWRRGLLAGLAVGTALTIKQSALGLLLVLFADELFARRAVRWRNLANTGFIVLGVLIAWAPVLAYLIYHGWLVAHLQNLADLTGRHAAAVPWRLPTWQDAWPLLPVFWWMLLGLIAWCGLWWDRPAPGAGRGAMRHEVRFVLLWLVAELAILIAMKKPSAHYLQPIVAPMTLLGCAAWANLRGALELLPGEDRAACTRWIGAGTVVLALAAVAPLLAAAGRRVDTFDLQSEVQRFQHRIERSDAPRDVE